MVCTYQLDTEAWGTAWMPAIILFIWLALAWFTLHQFVRSLREALIGALLILACILVLITKFLSLWREATGLA